MSFRLPPPARNPGKEAKPAPPTTELTLQNTLQLAIGNLLERLRVIEEPHIAEYFELTDRLGHHTDLDEDRIVTAEQTAGDTLVQEVRDAVIKEERRKLQFGSTVAIPDESTPECTKEVSVSSEEKQKFIEVLDAVAQINFSVRNQFGRPSPQETIEGIASVVLLEPVKKLQVQLNTYIATHSYANPNNRGGSLLIYNKALPYPRKLRVAILALTEVNAILKDYLEDPYLFTKLHSTKRELDLAERTEARVRDIIQGQYTECFAEIIAGRRAEKRTRKLGTTAVQEVEVLEDSEDLPVVSEPEKTAAEDHSIELTEIGTRIVRSPLHDIETQSARVDRFEYMGETIFIV